MNNIASNLHKIREQIANAERQYDRPAGSVQLLAVSKMQPVSAVQEAYDAGQSMFAENYLQEAIPKITCLTSLKIEWHFIGSIQSNKTKLIAENFAWVHSVDRLHTAERLSTQRSPCQAPLNICLQVNIDEEANKSGVSLAALSELACTVAKLPGLKLRGLMAIPKLRKEFSAQRQTFHKLKIALQQLQAKGLQLDTLSMGMSDDFIAAIAEGSTMLRIGTAIFGSRK